MKQFVALTACLAALVATSACSKPTTESTTTTVNNGNPSTSPPGTEAKNAEQALVRFINGTNQIADLYFGEMKVFAAVPAGGATPYVEIPAQRRDFKLYPSGTAPGGDPQATNSEGPTAGKHYTVLAVAKDDGKPTLNPISDDFDRPAPGKTKLRAINASTSAGDLDVWVPGTTQNLISGVGFNQATGYKEVDPTLAELDIRRGGSKKNELKITDLNLKPDKFYSVVVMGTKGSPIKYQVIEDQLNPPRG